MSEIDSLSKSVIDNEDQVSELLTEETQNRLVIYQRNYLYGLIEALKERFPHALELLGENNFKFFARQYILEHPSRDSNLDNYGDDFIPFLCSRPELEGTTYTFEE